MDPLPRLISWRYLFSHPIPRQTWYRYLWTRMESKQSSYSEPASARWWDRRVGGERPGQSWTPPSPMMLGCRLKHKYIFLVYIGFTYTFDISWKWKGKVTEIESDIIRYPLFSLTPCTIWQYHSDIFCSTPYHIYKCRILKYSPISVLVKVLFYYYSLVLNMVSFRYSFLVIYL